MRESYFSKTLMSEPVILNAAPTIVATPAGIAIVHSVFNIVATIILLPFAKGLEKLACLTIRDKKEDVVVSAEDREFMILEPRFLEKPAFAVEQSRNAARKMAEESHNALFTRLIVMRMNLEPIW